MVKSTNFIWGRKTYVFDILGIQRIFENTTFCLGYIFSLQFCCSKVFSLVAKSIDISYLLSRRLRHNLISNLISHNLISK